MEATGTTEPTTPTPPRLLVVEDDTTVRDFCVRLLRMNGYQVLSANNGIEALERLTEHRYDLVFTDLQMPQMGGIALLQAMRERYPETDTIVFTAHATVETAREALKLGAFDYLTKPVSVDDLERTVRRAMEWRRVRLEKERLSEIVALYSISQTFTGTLETATAVREIVRVLWQRFAPSTLSLSLLHPEDDQLELLAQNGAAIDLPPARASRWAGAATRRPSCAATPCWWATRTSRRHTWPACCCAPTIGRWASCGSRVAPTSPASPPTTASCWRSAPRRSRRRSTTAGSTSSSRSRTSRRSGRWRRRSMRATPIRWATPSR